MGVEEFLLFCCFLLIVFFFVFFFLRVKRLGLRWCCFSLLFSVVVLGGCFSMDWKLGVRNIVFCGYFGLPLFLFFVFC